VKSKSHSLPGARACALLGIGFIWLWLTTDSISRENQSQSPSEAAQAAGKEKGLRVLISAKEMGLDAVVLDKKGRQVTNLTADDFEIYQDNRKQIVTSCMYVNQDQARNIQMGTPKDSTTGRIIVFLVDNFSMDSVQVHRAQRLLQRFVEARMQQEDAVAVIQTLQEDSELPKFSSDKQFLLLVISKLQWSMDLRTMKNNARGSGLSSLGYCMKVLSNLPGRKHLIAISAEAMLLGSSSGSAGSFTVSPAIIESSYNSISDIAFRAGVVVHMLDISGLSGPDASDGAFSAARGSGRISPEEQAKMASKANARRNALVQIPMAKRTGGLFLWNSNLFDKGIGPLDEVLKGYYMLTYTPSADTFIPLREIDANNLPYHKIKIQLKHRTEEVLTRDGFFGVAQRENSATGN
jgi:VWFA-related protein